ncbi:MAG: hypothetical protein HY231_09175 [Acidobacteria bacterium]|nr:hypothetical protein [Acidobacteriota bacterium]
MNSKKALWLLVLLALCVPALAAQKNPGNTSSKAVAPKKEITPEEVERVSVDELILLMAKKKPIVIIDVRGKGGYSEKIKGAVQIPLDEIEARMKEIPRDKEIITYCA